MNSRLLWPAFGLILLLGFNLVTDPGFFAIALRDGRLSGDLVSIFLQAAKIIPLAVGMTLVIATGGVDLSVGSVLGFTGMLVAVTQAEWLGVDAPGSWPASVAIGLAAGVAVGAWHGFWISYRGIPAFVVTLAGLLVFRGAAYLITDGRTVAPLSGDFQLLGGGLHGSIGANASWMFAALVLAAVAIRTVVQRQTRLRHGFAPRPLWADALGLAAWSVGTIGFVSVMNAYVHPKTGLARGIPIPVLLWAATAIGMTALLRSTRFGRYVFAIGGNPEAAALAGIDVRRVTLYVFMWMGALAAVGAVITTARLGAGTNSMGTLAELSVIAAAVIGGTSLAGGRGSVPGAILGALIMQSLENGMLLLGVSSAVRQIAIGLVLMSAVWIDTAVGRRTEQR
jgi:D-xylose transport system permease protein